MGCCAKIPSGCECSRYGARRRLVATGSLPLLILRAAAKPLLHGTGFLDQGTIGLSTVLELGRIALALLAIALPPLSTRGWADHLTIIVVFACTVGAL